MHPPGDVKNVISNLLRWYCGIDPMLGNDRETKKRNSDHCYATTSFICNSTGAVATPRLARNNGSTIGSGVSYVVRSEATSLDRPSSVQLVPCSGVERVGW
jgi:hypothetical protein